MKIVVSIPVHEKPEVIKNQIANFKKYIENVTFVLHVSQSFFDKNKLEDIGEIEDVYINPIHLDTKWADIIHTHISNFRFISSVLDFDYFVLHASNDMYIKHGFSEYIQNYDAGFNIRKVITKHSHWWPGNMALNDVQLQNMMSDCGQTMIVASQVEGSFYKKELMERIVSVIETHYDADNKSGVYSREEIYFSTIASNMVDWDRIGYPTTYSEVHVFDRFLWRLREITRLIYYRYKLKIIVPQKVYNWFEEKYNIILFKSRFYRITKKTIYKILRNDKAFIEKNSILDDGSGQFRLYNCQIFAVKRVERNINDPIRLYISKL